MLDVALAAARAGADLLRGGELRRRPAEGKGLPGDWVTDVDRASEDAILEVLAREAPGVPVLAEERGGDLAETGWAVDPLDGTTNFTRGLPIVGVSVALLREGRPHVAVVLGPWLGVELTAERGRGASWNGERLPGLEAGDPARSIVSTGFPFRRKHLLPRYESVLGPALRRFEDLRRPGAASLDLGWTAAGRLDGFFELGLGPWDVAAGAALVLEVGGRVSDWAGGEGWLRSGDILAGPPAVHDVLLELAQAASTGD